MLYLLTKPSGFMEQPKQRSLMRALETAEGVHLFIYNDDKTLIAAKDLTADLHDFVIKHGMPNQLVRITKIDNLIRKGRAAGGTAVFHEFLVQLTENIIREAKGLPPVEWNPPSFP